VTAYRSQLTETEGSIPKLYAKKWSKVALCCVWAELWPELWPCSKAVAIFLTWFCGCERTFDRTVQRAADNYGVF